MKKSLLSLLIIGILSSYCIYAQVHLDIYVINHGSPNPTEATFADVNLSGADDVVIWNEMDSTLSWYRNDGDFRYTNIKIAGSLTGIQDAEVVNIDRDTTSNDIVCITKATGKHIVAYINDKSQNFTETVLAANVGTLSDIEVFDYDSDGDLDFAVSETTNDSIFIFINDGTTNFTKTYSFASIESVAEMQVIDIDNDNDLDVLASSLVSDKVAYYINDGAGGFTETLLSNTISVSHVEALDFDDDGDNDVLILDNTNGDLILLTNDGSMNYTNTVLISDIPSPHDFAMKDFDNDGDIDFIFSCSDNAGYWYENTGTGYNQIQFVLGREHQHVEISGTDILMTKAANDFEIYSIKEGLGSGFPKLPKNNSTDVSIFPTFEWTRVHGATGYVIQISDTNTFDNIFHTEESTQLTLDFNDFLFEELTTYYWKVQALTTTDTSGFSSVFFFTTEDYELDSCNLKSPADSSEFVSQTPTFAWTNDPHAQSFRIEISTNEDLSNPFLDSTFTDTSPFILKDTLSAKTKYFWRIKAIAPGSILESDIFEFTTLPDTYAAPTLLAPADTQPLADLSPEFNWSSVYAAKSYRLQVDTVSTFTSVIMDTTITDTNFVSAEGVFKENTTYFWRVMAMRDTNSSDWSAIFSLPITQEEMVVPTLISPADLSKNQELNVTLRWSVVPQVTGYEILLTWSGNTKKIIVTENSAQLDNLDRSTEYLWKVKALNETDTTEYSEEWKFITKGANVAYKLDNIQVNMLEVGLYNDDDLRDIFVPNLLSNTMVFKNSGDYTFEQQEIENSEKIFNLAVWDIDANNLDDVLLNSIENGMVNLFINPGSDEKTTLEIPTEGDSVLKAVFIEQGEQGLYDILYFSWAKKQFFISKYDSTKKEYLSKPVSEKDIKLNDFILKDINFDNKFDIVYHSPADAKIYAMTLNADTLTSSVLAEGVAVAYSMLKADYNNDGFEDIIFLTSQTAENDAIMALKNNGTDGFEKDTIWTADYLLNSINITDYNNDGYNDILINSLSGIACRFYSPYSKNKFKPIYDYNATYTKAADLNNDNYPDIIATSTSSQELIIIENTPLIKPILNSPVDSLEMVSNSPEFNWGVVENANSYDLIIFDNLGTLLYEFKTDTNYLKPNLTLDYGKFYSWTVRAENNVFITAWGEPEFFKTEVNKLEIPTLVSPTNNATDITVEPTLIWNSVTYAESYNVKVSTIENEKLITVLELVTADTSLVIPSDNLEYSKKYAWSVMAMAAHDSSDFSEEWLFTTEIEKVTQILKLEKGWNAISLNIVPEETDISKLFKDYPEIIKIADQFGNYYEPKGTDNIPAWDIKQAYDIRVTDDVAITIQGTAPTTEMNNYSLIKGINYISYPFTKNRAIEEAFEKAGTNVAYVYDGYGHLFMPSLNVDCIGKAEPGKGYKVYSKDAETFSYLNMETAGTAADIPLQDEAEYIKPPMTKPLDFCFIVVEADIPDGCEVVVFSEEGMIVGSGAVMKRKAVIAVYADDQTTQKTDGARTSEALELRYYVPAHYSFVKIYPENIKDAVYGGNVNTIKYNDAMVYHYKGYVVSVQEDISIENINVYPMPIKTTANIEVISEETRKANIYLFDLSGKPISNIYNGFLNKGENQFSFDSSNLNSGTYHIVIQTDKGVKSHKIIIEK